MQAIGFGFGNLFGRRHCKNKNETHRRDAESAEKSKEKRGRGDIKSLSLRLLCDLCASAVKNFTVPGRIRRVEKMRKVSSFVAIAISLLLTLLFVVPVFAAPRTSELNGGWQVWIDAADVSRREDEAAMKLGSEEPIADPSKPWLGQDVIIVVAVGGFMEYDFESPYEGDAYIYLRHMDFRGGGQSIKAALNSADDADTMAYNTGAAWAWSVVNPADGVPFVPLSAKPLTKGTNSVRIVPRESAAGKEPLVDIIMVSTVALEPTDDDYINAQPASAVQPGGKVATMWGAVKSSF